MMVRKRKHPWLVAWIRAVAPPLVLLILALLGSGGAVGQEPVGDCPQTQRLSSAGEREVLQVATDALADYRTPGIAGWEIASIEGADEWGIVAIVPVNPAGESLPGDGDILIAHLEEGVWTTALPDSPTFAHWLPLVPLDLLIPLPERNLYRASSEPEAVSAGVYKLPYSCGARAWVSRAGADHDNAIDFIIGSATRGGDPIVAAQEGWVHRIVQDHTACCCTSGYASNYTILRHPDGEYSYYLHLGAYSVVVQTGEWVEQGEPIAVEGDVGYTCSTAAGSCKTRHCDVPDNWDYCCEHLHLEVRDNGNWAGTRLNPRFEDVSGELVQSGQAYISGNCGSGCKDTEMPAGAYDDSVPRPGAYVNHYVELKGWSRDLGDCASGVEAVDLVALFDGEWNGKSCRNGCTITRLDEGCEGGSVCEFAYTWDLGGVPDGEILLDLEVTDRQGNRSLSRQVVRPVTKYSDDPPLVSLDLANGQTVTRNGEVFWANDVDWTFSGTAWDGQGVTFVTFQVQGNDEQAGVCSGTNNWQCLVPRTMHLQGANRIAIRAHDSLGQRSSLDDKHTIELLTDGVPPTTGYELAGVAGKNGWYHSSVDVQMVGQDSGSGWGPYAWEAGTESLHTRIDSEVWQQHPGPSVTISLDGDGAHTLAIYAQDHVGNKEDQQLVPVLIDATPPSAPGPITEVQGVPSGQWQRDVRDPAFTWEPATDGASGSWYYRVSWAESLQVTTTAGYVPQPAATGSYSLTVQAVDWAGHTGPTGEAFLFRYDGTRPHAPYLQNNDDLSSGVCQNEVRSADFAWETPDDGGSGIAGTYLYWGPKANGTSATLSTASTFVDATPICAEDEVATYYLRARSEDRVGWQSEWVAYALVYDGARPTATLTANDGLTITEDTDVALDISADDEGCGVTLMHLSDDGHAWSAWEDLSTETEWRIPNGPGQWHAIYLEVMDAAGNVSEVVSDSVYLEAGALLSLGGSPGVGEAHRDIAAPPECTFYRVTVDDGAAFTNDPKVTLRLCGPDPHQVMLSRDPSFTGVAWQPYSPTMAWTLDAGEERVQPQVVYARFQDSAGMIHGTFADDILLDRTPPQVEITFDLAGLLPDASAGVAAAGPLKVGDGQGVQLYVSATDDGSGLAEMQVSYSPLFDGLPWQPYSATLPLTFTTNGTHTVYVRLRDRAGNVTSAVSESLVVDTTPPAGTARVVEGFVGPTAISVTVELLASDNATGLDAVRIGPQESLAGTLWQPYALRVAAPISSTGALTSALYVQFRDGAGNHSDVISTTYGLDGTPPYGWVEYLGHIPSNVASYQLNVEDDLSGLAEIWISPDYWFLEKVERVPFEETLTWQFVEGPYLFAVFADAAGNLSQPYLLVHPYFMLNPHAVYLPLVVRVH